MTDLAGISPTRPAGRPRPVVSPSVPGVANQLAQLSLWVGDRPALAWTITAVIYAIALILRFAVQDKLPIGFQYVTFFPAVILTTFIAGLVPGIASAILCGLSAWFFFIVPYNSFAVTPATLLALVFYAAIVAIDIGLIHVMYLAIHRLRVEEARAAAALEAGKMGIWDLDLRTRQVAANARLFELLDVAPADLSTDADFLARVHPADRKRLRDKVNAAIASGTGFSDEFRVGDGQEPRWLGIAASLTGEARLTGIDWDTSELREAQERSELLLRELNHRIKNLFSVVASVISLSGRNVDTPEEAIGKALERVQALARAHDASLREGDVSISLERLVRSVLEPYEQAGGALQIEGPPVNVGPDQLTAFGLLVHELATNAAKYGALSSAGGALSIDWQVCDNGSGSEQVVFHWRETGGRPGDFKEPDQEGFGSRLIRQAAAQLRGDIEQEWAQEGLVTRLTLPLSGEGDATEDASG